MKPEVIVVGTVHSVEPILSGSSPKGEWKNRKLIIETEGEYPKLICLMLWNSMTNISFDIGESVTAIVDISSNSYGNNWYTNLKAYRIHKHNDPQSSPIPINAPDYSNQNTYNDSDIPDEAYSESKSQEDTKYKWSSDGDASEYLPF